MQIIKSSGKKEEFDLQKLCTSVKRSGLADYVADTVCAQIAKEIEPNASTRHIWRVAFAHLKAMDVKVSSRYSIKRGMAMLGPTGFVFEQYIEALMQSFGFETKRGVSLGGASGVDHEIDVWVRAGDVNALIEAKFKNDQGIKTHVDVVMYAGARLADIQDGMRKHNHPEEDIPKEIWIVTNTKFTDSAIKYGQYKNITLIGWDYPHNGSLEELVASKKMYPVSVLPSVTHVELTELAIKNIILLQDVLPYTQEDLSRLTNIPPEIARKIVNEAKELFVK